MEVRDGRRLPFGAVFVATRTLLVSPLAERLGCEVEEGFSGPMIKTNERMETTVAGVFAAGDAARANRISFAVADGVTAGVSAHQSPALA